MSSSKYIRLILFSLIACLFVTSEGFAKGKSSGGTVHVKGYTKKDGTYVPPHNRTAPNHTKNDNWSTRGNVNPYTGKAGTKPRDEDSSYAGTSPTDARGSQPRETSTYTPPAPKGITRIHSGMTKDEVRKELGEPNLSTATRWVYSGVGTVDFSSQGLTR